VTGNARTAGTIVVLNGAPRSGKSSIVRAIQQTFEGSWTNLGVDVFNAFVTPPRLLPGIGLRPGGERPELEPFIPTLFSALYESVIAHSRQGLNVVVDVGHHDSYSQPLGTLGDAARRLEGLPAYLIGIRCPAEVIMQRRDSQRDESGSVYETSSSDGAIPDAVIRWQEAVHIPGIYDLEIDTSTVTPEQAANLIGELIVGPPPTAFRRLRAMS
jgi:chloramphenicol 3-O phosphotransferase